MLMTHANANVRCSVAT